MVHTCQSLKPQHQYRLVDSTTDFATATTLNTSV